MEHILTQLWSESASDQNPFEAEECLCAGYDVYGDLLLHANWVDYLLLLIKKEQPSAEQTKLFNTLAIALANPGPRDPSIQAAMSAGAGGSTMASCLMAAIAVGAGNLGGAREVAIIMSTWQQLEFNPENWKQFLVGKVWQEKPPHTFEDVWLPLEHPMGFNPNGVECPKPLKQTLKALSIISPGKHLSWLNYNRCILESASQLPISMTMIAAATFLDLGFHEEQGEMLFLLLRLPGAAAHALEQREIGWKNYPFHKQGVVVTNDPSTSETNTKIQTKPNQALIQTPS